MWIGAAACLCVACGAEESTSPSVVRTSGDEPADPAQRASTTEDAPPAAEAPAREPTPDEMARIQAEIARLEAEQEALGRSSIRMDDDPRRAAEEAYARERAAARP